MNEANLAIRALRKIAPLPHPSILCYNAFGINGLQSAFCPNVTLRIKNAKAYNYI